MAGRVYVCVNAWRPRELPVLLVKSTRAKWAREKAARYSGFPFAWHCVRVRGVAFEGEVAEARPELLVNAELSPPPGMYWVPREVKERSRSSPPRPKP